MREVLEATGHWEENFEIAGDNINEKEDDCNKTVEYEKTKDSKNEMEDDYKKTVDYEKTKYSIKC